MSEHRRRILDMLAAGKITAEEADQLLGVLPAEPAQGDAAAKGTERGQYFRIEVLKPAHGDQREKKINIRVPVGVVRSGLRLGTLLRGFKDDQWGSRLSERLKARGLDVDFDHLDMAQLDTLLGEVGDVSIDVDDGRAQIRVVRE
jgi:hypothetical protein